MDEGGVADAFGTATGQTANEVRAMIQGSTLTGRFITPQHVADLVVFLASDRSGNTTGSDHPIDVGRHHDMSPTIEAVPSV
jgi:NAD(P)-dependent dehydrogenase (short-subunit alcohol dehydrogenase family)